MRNGVGQRGLLLVVRTDPDFLVILRSVSSLTCTSLGQEHAAPCRRRSSELLYLRPQREPNTETDLSFAAWRGKGTLTLVNSGRRGVPYSRPWVLPVGQHGVWGVGCPPPPGPSVGAGHLAVVCDLAAAPEPASLGGPAAPCQGLREQAVTDVSQNRMPGRFQTR